MRLRKLLLPAAVCNKTVPAWLGLLSLPWKTPNAFWQTAQNQSAIKDVNACGLIAVLSEANQTYNIGYSTQQKIQQPPLDVTSNTT